MSDTKKTPRSDTFVTITSLMMAFVSIGVLVMGGVGLATASIAVESRLLNLDLVGVPAQVSSTGFLLAGIAFFWISVLSFRSALNSISGSLSITLLAVAVAVVYAGKFI